MVELKSAAEIAVMREAGRVVAQALAAVAAAERADTAVPMVLTVSRAVPPPPPRAPAARR